MDVLGGLDLMYSFVTGTTALLGLCNSLRSHLEVIKVVKEMREEEVETC